MPYNHASEETLNSVKTQLVNPGVLAHGQKTVALAGTEEALVAAPSSATVGVTVKALATNTGNVYVGIAGVAAANGFVLAAGEQIFIPINDLVTIFIDVDTTGEGVSYMGN